MNELTQQLEAVYVNKNIDDIKSPFIINKFISFHPLFWRQAEVINKYLFNCNNKILAGLLVSQIPKCKQVPFIEYIKEKKEEENEYQFLLNEIKKFYNWSVKELKEHSLLLLKLFQNKENLKEYFRFFGIEKKYYKQFNIEFKQENKGLNKWFG